MSDCKGCESKMKRRCKCDICRLIRRMRALQRIQKSDRAKKFVIDLYERIENAETDAEYWKAKYHGQWPT